MNQKKILTWVAVIGLAWFFLLGPGKGVIANLKSKIPAKQNTAEQGQTVQGQNEQANPWQDWHKRQQQQTTRQQSNNKPWGYVDGGGNIHFKDANDRERVRYLMRPYDDNKKSQYEEEIKQLTGTNNGTRVNN